MLGSQSVHQQFRNAAIQMLLVCDALHLVTGLSQELLPQVSNMQTNMHPNMHFRSSVCFAGRLVLLKFEALFIITDS